MVFCLHKSLLMVLAITNVCFLVFPWIQKSHRVMIIYLSGSVTLRLYICLINKILLNSCDATLFFSKQNLDLYCIYLEIYYTSLLFDKKRNGYKKHVDLLAETGYDCATFTWSVATLLTYQLHRRKVNYGNFDTI